MTGPAAAPRRGPSPAPRELVLASAGTGKTHTISNRILLLLLGDAPPERIVASTFTRKAAGEILERVLERLARATLEPEQATRLAEELGLDPGDAPPPERWGELLIRVLSDLHRTGVSTLDSFFLAAVRSYGAELGLPPSWRIVDEPTDRRVRADALDDLIAGADRERFAELVRLWSWGDAGRRVHEALLEASAELVRLREEIDPAAESPWLPLPSFDAAAAVRADAPAAREALAGRVESADVPRKRDGSADGRFVTARAKLAATIRAGAWDALPDDGFAKARLHGTGTYYGKELTVSLDRAVDEAIAAARHVLGARINGRVRAMERLAGEVAEAVARRRRRHGAFRFDDLTRALTGPGAIPKRADLWYRLDRRVEHLLLDEFQDTSLAQWEALRPLATRVLDGGDPPRHALIVADPKQSIYGWRGASPDLVQRAAEEFGLPERTLARSWRSSSVVLDFVNALFERLPGNPALPDDPNVAATVADWSTAFTTHEPARDLPGHVRVSAGPLDPGRGTDRPQMMAHAARRVADLAAGAPGRSIGVLVRHVIAAARLTRELRELGIDASKESGSRIDDAPIVEAVLSLLRVADHPGDTLSRYIVARSPLGPLVGLAEPRDGPGAARLAAGLRARLLADGYGPVIERWTEALAGAGRLDAGGRRRLAQLAEIGHRWDAGATLRPSDFVRHALAERPGESAPAPVRVMTVHQAKGLEFDIVVLPELDVKLRKGRAGSRLALPERDPATGRIVRVFPGLDAALRDLFPEAGEALRQWRAAELRDSLGILYVAVTRARHALHLLLAADEPGKRAKRGGRGQSEPTFADLVRGALEPDGEPLAEGDVLYESGDSDWAGSPRALAADRGTAEGPATAVVPRVRSRGARRRLLSHTSPSALEGSGAVDLAWLLRLGGDLARRRGTIAHAWLERIRWMEDGLPTESELREVVHAAWPNAPATEVERLRADFDRWLAAPAVRDVLSRRAYASDARVETELPFVHRTGDRMLHGILDRLVLLGPGEGVREAEVIDFKTDAVGPDEAELERRAAWYAPQLEAYRAAVADAFGLAPGQVRGRLVFLDAGRTWTPAR
ncbi:MAG: UvrD-helicase domain-containing protein [Gemmatimonadota bacterium]|nr:UvrD-helicase domain-containing protein [Gemmatimonadota bacterium]